MTPKMCNSFRKKNNKMQKIRVDILPIACLSVGFFLFSAGESLAVTNPARIIQRGELTLGAPQPTKKPKKKEKKLFVWGTGNFSKGKDSYFLAQNKSKSFTGLLGIDYKFTPDFKLGFFYTNTYSKTRTRFTPVTTRSRDRSDASSIFLTGTYNFNPDFFLIVALGYNHTPSHTSRFNNNRGFWITSKTKSNLYSVSPALNYSLKADALTAAFQAGYGRNDSYKLAATDSTGRPLPKSSSHINTAFLFTDWSYKFKKVSENIEGLSPFIQAGYNHAFQTPPLRDPQRNIHHRGKNGWSTGAGLRFFFVNDISMNLGWQYVSSKKKSHYNGVGFTIRAGVY
jgi:outer membrane autotransporter protein